MRIAALGRIGKKRSKGGKPLHGGAPSVLSAGFILQEHVQMPGEQAYHAGLGAPEIVGKGAMQFQMFAANCAKSGKACGKALGKRRMLCMKARKALPQQGLLSGVVQKKKGSLPDIFQQGAAGMTGGWGISGQCVQPQRIAPGTVEGKPPCAGFV